MTNGYLTPRETEIMKLIAIGHTYEEAANMLGISRETLKSNIFNVRIRFDARNITQAIAISVKSGFIEI